MTYATNPCYGMQGAKNSRRAARQMGKRGNHNHESHGSRWDWSVNLREAKNVAPVVARPDLVAEYNRKLGV